MAKNRKVLLKAQEQVDYASSRCGNLIDQLNKIKSHVKWKWCEENLSQVENLERKKHDIRYKDGMLVSADSNLSNSNLENDQLHEKEETKRVMNIFYEELSSDQKNKHLLPQNSSSFESVLSENFSTELTSIEKDELEVEDPSEEYKQQENKDSANEKKRDDVVEELLGEPEEEKTMGKEDENVLISFFEKEEDNEKKQTYDKIDFREKASDEEKTGGSVKELEEQNMLVIENEEKNTKAVEEMQEEEQQVEGKNQIEEENFLIDEQNLGHQEDSETRCSSLSMNLFPEAVIRDIVTDNIGLEPPIELKQISSDENVLQKCIEQISEMKADDKETMLKFFDNYDAQESNETKKTQKNLEKLKNISDSQNHVKNFKENQSIYDEQSKTKIRTSKVDVIKKKSAPNKHHDKQSEAMNQIERTKRKRSNKEIYTNEINNKIMPKMNKFSKVLSGKSANGGEHFTTEIKTRNENSTKEREIIPGVNADNYYKKNITSKHEIFKKEINTKNINSLQNYSNKHYKNKQNTNDFKHLSSQIPINTASMSTQKNQSNLPIEKIKTNNSKIQKSQNRLKVKKSSHEIITKTLFDNIQQTLRRNLNYTNGIDQSENKNIHENSTIQNNSVTKNVTNKTIININRTLRKTGIDPNERIKTKNDANIKMNKTLNKNYLTNMKEINKNNSAKTEQKKVNKIISSGKLLQDSKSVLNELELFKDETNANSRNFKTTTILKYKREQKTTPNLLNNKSHLFKSSYNVVNSTEVQKAESADYINDIKTKQYFNRSGTENKNVIPKYSSETWEDRSLDLGKTYGKQLTNNHTMLPNFPNNNNRESNITLAQSLGFNTIPFIVGQSTSRSYHIGLNIQQTLSLMKLSPSVPDFKIGVEANNGDSDSEKYSLANVSKATYKPKTCPACLSKPFGHFKDDEDILSEDPWYVPQKDTWDQLQIANRKNTRCTCLPSNIISFNELLRQTFQADGLMASRPRSNRESYDHSIAEFEQDRDGKEKRKLNIRPNNASYLTRLLRNIQRIQDQYIMPITKLSLSGIKYNTP